MQRDGYSVDWVKDGQAGRLALDTMGDAYALVLLDLGLPKKGGLELLREVRRGGNKVRVLIVTAKDEIADRVGGPRRRRRRLPREAVQPGRARGADARAAAPRRRARRQRAAQRRASSLDPSTRTVTRDGAPVELSKREFALLAALLERPGTALSKAQLEERLYGWGDEVESNAVEVHVHNLRRKLGADAIRTIRGVGYVIARA